MTLNVVLIQIDEKVGYIFTDRPKLAARIGVSERTIYRWMMTGDGYYQGVSKKCGRFIICEAHREKSNRGGNPDNLKKNR